IVAFPRCFRRGKLHGCSFCSSISYYCSYLPSGFLLDRLFQNCSFSSISMLCYCSLRCPDSHLSCDHRMGSAEQTVITVGNSCKAVDEEQFEWTVFVRGDGARWLKRVTFQLHPTFSPPCVTLNSAPWSLTRVG